MKLPEAKWGRPHLWIALSSAAAVVAIAAVDVERTSPGALSSVHSREADLAGKDGCSGCHGGWTTSMPDACLECHALIGEHIEEEDGLHGTLGDRARRCSVCHSEHHGPGFAVVNVASFAQAGVADPEAFEHGLVGFEMAGAHLELGCSECHVNADVDVLEPEAHRYIGLESDCAACHEDVHEGSMGEGCATCHGQESFQQLESAGHERFLPLTGGHAAVDCRTCHALGSGRSLEDLAAARVRPRQRECADCHPSPHEQAFVDGTARLESRSPSASCGVCHQASHVSFDDPAMELDARLHAASGFLLAPPHDQAACTDCHLGPEASFEERYPGRSADACAACHEDPHGGQFQVSPFAQAGCIACHARETFTPHAFGVEEHAQTEMPLTGSHLDTDCAACHLDPPADEPRRFEGTSSRCESCHTDAHAGFFEPRHAELAPQAEDRCSSCHLTTSFDDVARGAFDHGAWTGFAIAGAHAQARCETCHPKSELADEHGRSFGRVAEHFGAYTGCVTCHVDPHRGRFDGEGHDALVDGKGDCARCHVETSFRMFPEGFAHGRWTGFPLQGAHQEAGCSACHAPLRPADELGRTWAAAAGSRCESCHADPHVGQFEIGGRTTCERCHTSARSFAQIRFRHSSSRFSLGEAHRSLDCGACHRTETTDEGLEFVRYRPLGTECVDCHGVDEGPMRRTRTRRGK